jgi:hypothetical protein
MPISLSSVRPLYLESGQHTEYMVDITLDRREYEWVPANARVIQIHKRRIIERTYQRDTLNTWVRRKIRFAPRLVIGMAFGTESVLSIQAYLVASRHASHRSQLRRRNDLSRR